MVRGTGVLGSCERRDISSQVAAPTTTAAAANAKMIQTDRLVETRMPKRGRIVPARDRHGKRHSALVAR